MFTMSDRYSTATQADRRQDDGRTTTLDRTYAQRNSCALQWRTFLALLTGELEARIDQRTAENFYRQVGTRMAEAMPLPVCNSLTDLHLAVAAMWERLDWGWVEFADEGKALRITHGAYPVAMLPDEPATTPGWLGLVLEGVYSSWLAQLGGTGLVARCRDLAVEPGQPFVFDVRGGF